MFDRTEELRHEVQWGVEM